MSMKEDSSCLLYADQCLFSGLPSRKAGVGFLKGICAPFSLLMVVCDWWTFGKVETAWRSGRIIVLRRCRRRRQAMRALHCLFGDSGWLGSCVCITKFSVLGRLQGVFTVRCLPRCLFIHHLICFEVRFGLSGCVLLSWRWVARSSAC